MSLDVYIDDGDTYSANITHNLGRMASEAGIYEVLWRPDEMVNPTEAAVLRDAEQEQRWAEADAIRKAFPRRPIAVDLIAPLRAGLALLKSDPLRFEKFNAPNGWGLYRHFVPFVEQYLEALEAKPDGLVTVSR